MSKAWWVVGTMMGLITIALRVTDADEWKIWAAGGIAIVSLATLSILIALEDLRK